MKTGYFGNSKTGRATKTHIIYDDTKRPVCGVKFTHCTEYQWCSPGINWSYVECRGCKDWLSKQPTTFFPLRILPLQNGPTMARVFFFHYNKPASQKAKKPVISVHWQGKCHLCDNVDIHVPTFGRIRKRQPYFIMVGRGVVHIENGIAVITAK